MTDFPNLFPTGMRRAAHPTPPKYDAIMSRNLIANDSESHGGSTSSLGDLNSVHALLFLDDVELKPHDSDESRV